MNQAMLNWFRRFRFWLPSTRSPEKQRTWLTVEALEDRTVLDGNSAGGGGINALGLGLTGDKVVIGEVDHWRLGSAANGDAAALRHPDITPAGVYWLDKIGDKTNQREIHEHPLAVAGIIVSKSDTHKGVAPGAKLHSSGFDSDPDSKDQTAALTSMHYIATLDTRAINMSWGFPTQAAKLDADSQVSLGLDYLARRYDTLFVIAKGQGVNGAIPQDSYNSLVVGASVMDGFGGQYAWDKTDFTVGLQDRRFIHLMAPGVRIQVPRPGADGSYALDDGTSYATPHATGAVALLQEHIAQKSGWANEIQTLARKHEVMKAVLLNSADKVRGALGSGRHARQSDRRTT